MGQSEPGRRLGTFGLVGSPLVPFPFPSPTSSSVRKPGSGSRLLYTGHRMASKQVSSTLIPEQSPVLVSSGSLSMRHRRFACARLPDPYMTQSQPRLLTMTFTTADFGRSSSWRFEASSYKTAPEGLPPSLAQHDAFASS